MHFLKLKCNIKWGKTSSSAFKFGSEKLMLKTRLVCENCSQLIPKCSHGDKFILLSHIQPWESLSTVKPSSFYPLPQRCIFYLQSTLDISKLWGLFFFKFKLPEVQINLYFGYFGLVKKSPTPNYGWRKQSKRIFDSDRRFQLRRIRDIRVRDIEIWLYLNGLDFLHLYEIWILNIIEKLCKTWIFSSAQINVGELKTD